MMCIEMKSSIIKVISQIKVHLRNELILDRVTFDMTSWWKYVAHIQGFVHEVA